MRIMSLGSTAFPDFSDWFKARVKKFTADIAAWVLLDFSKVDICDSFYGRFIQSVAQMVKLAGAKVIVSGLNDAVVETLVELGLTLSNIHAVLDLDDALALSRESEKADERTSYLGDEVEIFDEPSFADGSFPSLTPLADLGSEDLLSPIATEV